MDTAMVDVWQREVSKLSNRKFTHHLTASQDLVVQLDVSNKLEKNYVKTVIFSADAIELLRCQPIGGCSVQNPVIPLYAIAIDPRNPSLFAVV
ncbi:hypothetical protein V6N13_063830 [Hibiscus sabdariffa]